MPVGCLGRSSQRHNQLSSSRSCEQACLAGCTDRDGQKHRRTRTMTGEHNTHQTRQDMRTSVILETNQRASMSCTVQDCKQRESNKHASQHANEHASGQHESNQHASGSASQHSGCFCDSKRGDNVGVRYVSSTHACM